MTYNSLYGTLPSTAKDDHKFLGWFTSSNQRVDSTTKYVTVGNSTLYAKWEKNPPAPPTVLDKYVSLIGKTTQEAIGIFPQMILDAKNEGSGYIYGYPEESVNDEFYFEKVNDVFLLSHINTDARRVLNITQNIDINENEMNKLKNRINGKSYEDKGNYISFELFGGCYLHVERVENKITPGSTIRISNLSHTGE